MTREIKGTRDEKIKGRFNMHFKERFWHKWINWDLRFLKIDFDDMIVLGSRNIFLLGFYEVNFGWILSRKPQLSQENTEIAHHLLDEYLDIKEHHVVKFDDL